MSPGDIESPSSTGGDRSSTDTSPGEKVRKRNESQHQHTVGSNRDRIEKEKWLPMGGGRPYPLALPDPEMYVVQFDGPDDPIHPHNWPMGRRVVIASLLTFCALVTAYGSAIFATAATEVSQQFHVSGEVTALGTTLYVLGFTAGPTIWAPFSELFGRRWPMLIGMLGFDIFTIASATGKDLQTIMLTRFFAGFFAASVITLVQAIMRDLFDSETRGIAIATYTMAVFTGPFTAPNIGGFTAASYLAWRWTLHTPAFVGFFSLTCPPVILTEKAAILRRQTRDWGIHAKQDEKEVDLKELVTKNFARPLQVLFTEPIAFLLTLYMSFIYGLSYCLLVAYLIIFQGVYGMATGVNGLPFIGLIVGELVGGAFVLMQQKTHSKKRAANNGTLIPEWRLTPCIVGGVVFAAGLFWFGWTAWNSSIHWLAPVFSGIFVGFGLMAIFVQGFNYLLDVYSNFSASAFAANTMMRSAVGACFPLFTPQMFGNLRIQWAGTLLGCLATVMVPIPVLFMIFGRRLRKKSRLAPTT
ncbi:hypothetical protein ASPSYDRAFT_60694 [Aspergillus sydowii CBS 593.65]|uniref:Major facilitator superfamily (MFS) profile domain-containing protein n=1 Tax=Aspergillus sydowii CBS 593.65 TaxID=1036612 RepID=A0A1L9T694_9EURO|nr:uncharacterized protein ASPSYDRAFT_60694 [Aspergillus sydowii CBS 593.65]OJJ54895.1 hypothetical protein ASPSYDRAFT_60694 [Aspergillus sydowii CBS 593.65]